MGRLEAARWEEGRFRAYSDWWPYDSTGEVLSLMLIQILAVLGPKDIGVQLRQPSPPLGRHLEMPDCRGDLG